MNNVKIQTIRGAFRVVASSIEKIEELKKEGYGYYFAENGYTIFGNGTRCIAFKNGDFDGYTISPDGTIEQKKSDHPLTMEKLMDEIHKKSEQTQFKNAKYACVRWNFSREKLFRLERFKSWWGFYPKKYSIDYDILPYRIIALRDIIFDDGGKIAKWTFGGMVMAGNNISHVGKCWIDDDVSIHDENTYISDNAYIGGGNIDIYSSHIGGNSIITGSALVVKNVGFKDEKIRNLCGIEIKGYYSPVNYCNGKS